jgi:hypothetical protein
MPVTGYRGCWVSGLYAASPPVRSLGPADPRAHLPARVAFDHGYRGSYCRCWAGRVDRGAGVTPPGMLTYLCWTACRVRRPMRKQWVSSRAPWSCGIQPGLRGVLWMLR